MCPMSLLLIGEKVQWLSQEDLLPCGLLRLAGDLCTRYSNKLSFLLPERQQRGFSFTNAGLKQACLHVPTFLGETSTPTTPTAGWTAQTRNQMDTCKGLQKKGWWRAAKGLQTLTCLRKTRPHKTHKDAVIPEGHSIPQGHKSNSRSKVPCSTTP